MVDRKTARQQLDEDLRAVMSTAAGRRVMWYVLSLGRVFNLSMTGNSMTFFHEGRRSLGLVLMRDLQLVSRKLWRQMEDECAGPSNVDEVEVKNA